jgi:hypothetical protein
VKDLAHAHRDVTGRRENTGDGEFEEKWFYPMYGASGLEIVDFDQD